MALVTTVGGASANSYGDADGAAAYFLATGRADQWDRAVAGLPEAWLLRAMPYLEAQEYPGSRASSTQALEFPRVGGHPSTLTPTTTSVTGLYDLRGRFWASTAIPQPLKDAQYEQALAMAENEQWLSDSYRQSSVTAGSATLQKRTGWELGTLCKVATVRLTGLLLSQRGVKRLVRS